MTEFQLRPVTADNLRELVHMEMRPGQERYVAPVVHSIAEAYVNPTAWPRAIYSGDSVVGFVMANFDPDNEIKAFRCGIWRLNIAADSQGLGAGYFAVEEVAREARSRGCEEMTVMWVPGVNGPEGFYLRCGFVPTGEILFDEIVGVRSTQPRDMPHGR
ncbi:GNAT family N-acetyltransferase [Flaviflexus salsibiostraticola]|uniref:GNAT family N-acetyltransferase n=1 Tax=Flaviflexus salsibiostraticola TaxID=1282737 RepID=A0A3S8ZBA5_9ACTO|nr:GNAT family N-acetyltransferase [Flaviflexus salsibiostraticola]AZN30779.1 GNAT family N-acetyltransferase [Flaviflexus salsibiostraticola]